jgi:hypothetical protein
MITTHDEDTEQGKGTKNETSLETLAGSSRRRGLQLLVSPFAEKWSRRGVGHEQPAVGIAASMR